MHVKALRPILPQAMNNKVKTYKFCVFTCEQLHSLLGESLYSEILIHKMEFLEF